MSTGQLMTASELSALLGVSKQKCYRWADAGLLPGVKRFGRSVYFIRAQVTAWLESAKILTENSPRPQDIESDGHEKQPMKSVGCETLQTISKRHDTQRNGAPHHD